VTDAGLMGLVVGVVRWRVNDFFMLSRSIGRAASALWCRIRLTFTIILFTQNIRDILGIFSDTI
jgi:hypothetical protein